MKRFAVFVCLLFTIAGTFSWYILRHPKEAVDEYAVWELQCMNEYYESQDFTIYIDVPASKMYVFKDNQILKDYKVLSDGSSFSVPSGIWRIISKTGLKHDSENTWMGLNVPWGSFGICGINTHGQGSFKISNNELLELSSFIKFGTKVEVYGGPLGPFGRKLRIIMPGDRGSDVLEVQKLLMNRAYYEGKLDGTYGSEMEAAVLSFQRDNKLKADRKIGNQMYQLLGIIPFE